MKCLYPKYIITKPYKTYDNQYKKFGSFGTKADFENSRAIPVSCSKCENCNFNKFNNWKTRLIFHSLDKNVYFLTLTISPDYMKKIDISNWVKTIQNFFKRFRKNNNLTSEDIQYYWVVELGSKKLRLHYHCLIFTSLENNLLDLDLNSKTKTKRIHNNLYYVNEKIQKSWKFGYHSISKIVDSKKAITYVLKYLLKKPLAYGYSKNLGIQNIKKTIVDSDQNYYLYNGYMFQLPGSLQNKDQKFDKQRIEYLTDLTVSNWKKSDIRSKTKTKIFITKEEVI